MVQHFNRRAISLVLICLLASCHSDVPPEHNTLRRALSGEPSTLDPRRAADSFSMDVLRDVYEGLTAESPTGDVIPGVAAEWTVDPAGRRYTFTIRADARWSNGKPVRAQDFVSSWRRVVDPQLASPGADDLRLIQGASDIIAGKAPVTSLGVEALNDSTLVLTLARPAPYFLQILAHPSLFPIYSEASAGSQNASTWISNGAYVLQSWLPGTEITLTKNPDYWDRAHVGIPKVEYFFIPDETVQYARYRAEQLDLTDSVPPNAADTLRRERPSELVTSPFLATAYYGMNLVAGPLHSNVNLRQALAMAIDRKRLTAFLQFGQTPAYGLVPPGTWNYSPQSWEWRDLSDADRIAKAKQLYGQAGYSSATPLHLRLLYNSNPVIQNIAIASAAMWKDTLGIDIELIQEEYRVFLETRHDKSKWELGRFAWTADFNDASNFLDIFRRQSTNNEEAYANDRFDAVLDSAAATADLNARRSLLEKGEQMLLHDYPIAPLYFFVSKRLIKPGLRGVRMNPLNHIASKSLSFSAA